MGSLNESLAALKAAREAKRDPSATALMNQATEDLRASGILDGVRPVGSTAPLFARPNLEGATVRLRTLLQRGPVVLSFFRGRW
jgi:hypothetical protein